MTTATCSRTATNKEKFLFCKLSANIQVEMFQRKYKLYRDFYCMRWQVLFLAIIVADTVNLSFYKLITTFHAYISNKLPFLLLPFAEIICFFEAIEVRAMLHQLIIFVVLLLKTFVKSSSSTTTTTTTTHVLNFNEHNPKVQLIACQKAAGGWDRL
ncbi:hypothetical protein T07_4743 [Trichinella nelsoni]|uniref:Uncharacterized protein n=1 Tax=Trichinella nelsoni TaxID=6336 RepID=A0A0V0RSD2_9BILA|nr:hypothetical protein T07_4743 [Trichinella nelsoni]